MRVLLCYCGDKNFVPLIQTWMVNVYEKNLSVFIFLMKKFHFSKAPSSVRINIDRYIPAPVIVQLLWRPTWAAGEVSLVTS